MINTASEQAVQMTHQLFGFAAEYFEKAQVKIDNCSKQSLQELEIFRKFVNDLCNVGTLYERSLFHLCEELQHKMKDQVHDEKLMQYFQLVINAMLRYSDKVQKKYQIIDRLRKQLVDKEIEFSFKITENLMSIDSSIRDFLKKRTEFESSYRAYVTDTPSLIAKGNSPTPDTGLYPSEMSPANSIDALEENAVKAFSSLESNLNSLLNGMEANIASSSLEELLAKNELKDCSITLINALAPQSSLDLQTKVQTLENHMENFKSYFGEIRKESTLEFNPILSLKTLQFKFVPWRQINKLASLLEHNLVKVISEKLRASSYYVSPKVKIYVEIFLEFLFTTSFDFTKEIWDELGYLMEVQATRDYFAYSLILKKVYLMKERLNVSICLKDEQIRNLKKVSDYLFENHCGLADSNVELFYHYLRFCQTVFNEHKDCLLEHLGQATLLYSSEFWKRVHAISLGFIKASSGTDTQTMLNNSSFNSPLVFGLKLLVENIKQGSKENANRVKDQSLKAFEETFSFVVSLNLPFEVVTEIIVALCVHIQQPLDSVKPVILRNQDLLFIRAEQSNLPNFTYKRQIGTVKYYHEKNDKLVFCFKTVARFIDSYTDLNNLTQLNKSIHARRASILLPFLACINFPCGSELRKRLLLLRINDKLAISKLASSFSSSSDNIISLDVRRTICPSTHFDQRTLETVLNNIADPNIGKFPYYQGLNYVTCYFLVQFKGDPLLAYNFTISLLERFYAKFIKFDFGDIKRLFHTLKQITRIRMPVLFNYLEKERNLDLEVIIASWCLTMFTTVSQYHADCQLLDEIADIFVAEGWIGFAKIMLVILRTLSDKLMCLSYEEILIFFTDLAKTNFKDLLEASALNSSYEKELFNELMNISGHETRPNDFRRAEDRFSFKEETKSIAKIDKHMMRFYESEYMAMQVKLDEFWSKMTRTVKQ
jgi:hypothetical protein